jgi:hypothetical protein
MSGSTSHGDHSETQVLTTSRIAAPGPDRGGDSTPIVVDEAFCLEWSDELRGPTSPHGVAAADPVM